ncbi:CHAP domain-containing protein, partial [Propionibacterium freudenreichii]|uniref:CHAP domain-containing protein n=1 Tax=Propionibacterium freudenreichii TaxID=1744 RepID=UPI003853EF58
ALNYFRKTRRTTFSPAPGDIVFFDWDLNGNVEHAGIFVKWIDKNHFECIEGNTAVGNDSNGGEVMIRKRHKKFAKFVHPECLD